VATVSLNYLSVWDYAAGHALVRGAGGVLVDERGAEVGYDLSGPGVKSRIFAGGRGVVRQLAKQHWESVNRSGFGEAAAPPEGVPLRGKPGALMHESEVLSRAQGCLIGQLAGDALGALVEFESAERIARQYRDAGPRFLADGGPHDIMAGQPTDDSELALVLARSIVARGGFDREATAATYAGWYHGWTHANEPSSCEHRWCRPFDVGGTTAQALGAIGVEHVRRGEAADCAHRAANPKSQANGALMRISPLGIWGAFRDAAEIARAAREDAQLTHPHRVCQDASAVFAISVAAAIRHALEPRQVAAHALEWGRAAELDPSVLRVFEEAQLHPPKDYLTQQGWVLVALGNAFYQLLHTTGVEEAVVATVRHGGDTDTNAAICGALVGAVYGRDGIPAQWQKMVLSCRPMPGVNGIRQPRPAVYWPTDGLLLAERLLGT